MSRTTSNRRKRKNRRDLMGHIPRKVKRYFKYYFTAHDFFSIPITDSVFEEPPLWKRYFEDAGPVVLSPSVLYRSIGV